MLPAVLHLNKQSMDSISEARLSMDRQSSKHSDTGEAQQRVHIGQQNAEPTASSTSSQVRNVALAWRQKAKNTQMLINDGYRAPVNKKRWRHINQSVQKQQRSRFLKVIEEAMAAGLSKEEKEEQDSLHSLDIEKIAGGVVKASSMLIDKLTTEVYNTEGRCLFFPMIEPDSHLKNLWDWLIVLIAVYFAIKLPYVVAFNVRGEITTILDYLFDVLFAIDIFLSFHEGYFNEFGDVVMDPKTVGKRYLKGTFWLDLIATLPFELVIYALATDIEGQMGSNQKYLGLLKLPRLLRLTRLAKKVHSIAAGNSLRIVKLLCGFVLVCHWIGCIWFAIGQLQDAENRWTVVNGLEGEGTDQEAEGSGNIVYRQYTASLYWAMTTLTTVGYGDISPGTETERWFTVVCFLLGSIVYSTIFANVSILLQNFDRSGQLYSERMEALNDLLRFHQVPDALAERVRNNVSYSWSLSGGFNLHQVLDTIPWALRVEVCMNLYESVIRQAPMFRDVHRALIQEIAIRLQPLVALPGTWIFHQGDVGHEMLFVARGTLQIFTGKNEDILLANVLEGSFFGEGALFFNPARRSASVRALTYVEMFSMSKDDFELVLINFPEEKEHILSIADQRRLNQRKHRNQANNGRLAAGAQQDDREEKVATIDDAVQKAVKSLFADAVKDVTRSFALANVLQKHEDNPSRSNSKIDEPAGQIGRASSNSLRRVKSEIGLTNEANVSRELEIMEVASLERMARPSGEVGMDPEVGSPMKSESEGYGGKTTSREGEIEVTDIVDGERAGRVTVGDGAHARSENGGGRPPTHAVIRPMGWDSARGGASPEPLQGDGRGQEGGDKPSQAAPAKTVMFHDGHPRVHITEPSPNQAVHRYPADVTTTGLHEEEQGTTSPVPRSTRGGLRDDLISSSFGGGMVASAGVGIHDVANTCDRLERQVDAMQCQIDGMASQIDFLVRQAAQNEVANRQVAEMHRQLAVLVAGATKDPAVTSSAAAN